MRLKHLFSHNRNIDMTMTTGNIKYCIPLYGDKDHIGQFVSAKIKDGFLTVTFKSKDTEALVNPVVVRTEPNFIVDFNK